MQVSFELNANGDCQKCCVEPLNQWTRPSDFPAINPAFSGSRNTYIYSASSSGSRRFLPHFPFDSVAKINTVDGSVSMWSARCRRFIGEPIFVPKGNDEDDGYLLVVEVRKSTNLIHCYFKPMMPRYYHTNIVGICHRYERDMDFTRT